MNNKEKILKEIFENPTYEFHVRELARNIRLNPNTIINITNELANDKIIIKKHKKNLVTISANTENIEFIRAKRIFNLSQLYNSSMVDFLIEYYLQPNAIIVFGSYSRGEDIERSDIDITVITNKKDIPNLTKFEKMLKRKVHLLALSYENMSQEFYRNIINGITLYGYLK